MSIIPDTRLQLAWWCKATRPIGYHEQLLKVLDQKDSPEDVLVVPKPQIIPVHYKTPKKWRPMFARSTHIVW